MSGQTKLTDEELHRYARHISLPSFGMEVQKRLKESSVLCIGAGGLGSPSTMYLAAAGVGRIGLMDMDEVDESNIQRQLLHGTGDVGRKKIESKNPFMSLIKELFLLYKDFSIAICCLRSFTDFFDISEFKFSDFKVLSLI